MTLVRHVLVTLAAVLVVLVGAATAEAANPVVAAAKRTADARSSLFDMQMTVEAGGQRVAITGTGAMRGQDTAKLAMRTIAAVVSRTSRLTKEPLLGLVASTATVLVGVRGLADTGVTRGHRVVRHRSETRLPEKTSERPLFV